MTIKISSSTLYDLPDSVQRPAYERSNLSAGILHIGVGNFHRAHQAIYMDDLFNLGEDQDWAILGAGIRDHDKAVREDLQKQDWLTTVVELDPSGLSARICGSMIDYLDIDTTVLIEALAQPNIKIVSLTVTEGGYFIDAVTGGVQLDHPELRHDIANPENPKTVFGCMLAALVVRRETGVPPFTVMSCDNLPGNGHVTKEVMVELAYAISEQLGAFIKAEVSFPNGMVDCITPATSDRERQIVREQFDIEDARPVVCEPFRQWVLEDKFPTGRPALEKVGVEFVEDVAPYELMKLRILNGGHAIIAYPSALIGLKYAHDAMAHPLISAYLKKLETMEIIPTVAKIPGVDFAEYFNTVSDRFSNEAVGDTIPRLCLDGSNRQPKFIIPTIKDRLDVGLDIRGLAIEVAFWARYCLGQDEAGNEIFIDDENADSLKTFAQDAKNNPVDFLENEVVFGDLAQNDIFCREFCQALNMIYADGTEAVLRDYLGR